LEIRRASADDAASISNLVSKLSEKYIIQEFNAGGAEYLLASMEPDAIKKYIDSGFKYHVAEIDKRVVGVVGIRDNSHLYHLFVDEKYQRRGIARELWQLARETCLDNGNPGEFTVNSSRYARVLYEKLGFVVQTGPQEKNGVLFFPMKLNELPHSIPPMRPV